MQINYTTEVLRNIKDIQTLLIIEDTAFNPVGFSITFFIYCAIFMPFLAMYVFVIPREEIIKDLSGAILKSYFKLDDK